MAAEGASGQTMAQGQPKPSALAWAINTTTAPDAARALSTERTQHRAEFLSSGVVHATSLA